MLSRKHFNLARIVLEPLKGYPQKVASRIDVRNLKRSTCIGDHCPLDSRREVDRADIRPWHHCGGCIAHGASQRRQSGLSASVVGHER
jgi:hypothetical protein